MRGDARGFRRTRHPRTSPNIATHLGAGIRAAGGAHYVLGLMLGGSIRPGVSGHREVAAGDLLYPLQVIVAVGRRAVIGERIVVVAV
jgi:hypothetical protein